MSVPTSSSQALAMRKLCILKPQDLVQVCYTAWEKSQFPLVHMRRTYGRGEVIAEPFQLLCKTCKTSAKPTCTSNTAGTFRSHPTPPWGVAADTALEPMAQLEHGQGEGKEAREHTHKQCRWGGLRFQLFGSMRLFTNDVCKCNYYISF